MVASPKLTTMFEGTSDQGPVPGLQLPSSERTTYGDRRPPTVRLPAESVPTTQAPREVPPTSVFDRPPASSWKVEEYFHGVVDEVTDAGLRALVTSSQGEEATAWIDWARIDASERPYAIVGAPVRVSILQSVGGTRRREQRVRFLRPSQYQPSVRDRERVAAYFKERLDAALSAGG